MESVLYCLKKIPGEHVRAHTIENKLEKLQEFVGGYIETVTIEGKDGKPVVIICNDEGRFTKEYNCTVDGIDLYGKLLFVGVEDGGEDGDEFASLDLQTDPKEFEREHVKEW